MLRFEDGHIPRGKCESREKKQEKALCRRSMWNSINSVWDYAVSNGVTG